MFPRETTPAEVVVFDHNTPHQSLLPATRSLDLPLVFIVCPQKPRKRPPRGVKLANEKAVLEQFQISVSNRVNMIGRDFDVDRRHDGLA